MCRRVVEPLNDSQYVVRDGNSLAAEDELATDNLEQDSSKLAGLVEIPENNKDPVLVKVHSEVEAWWTDLMAAWHLDCDIYPAVARTAVEEMEAEHAGNTAVALQNVLLVEAAWEEGVAAAVCWREYD